VQRAVVFAGFGGQGLLFAGQVLAQAALDGGLETLWIPSYGPEMRGGTACCSVIVADGPIGSPVVDRLDAAIVLNPPSLARFVTRVAPGGVVIVNKSLVGAGIERPVERSDVRVIAVPCTEAADAAGDERLTAVVGLGTLAVVLLDDEGHPAIDLERVRGALRDLVGRRHPELLEADARALEAGVAAGLASQAPAIG
jgi:2-oxoglutarate ferredoxin oxidoreductase subunit gamma